MRFFFSRTPKHLFIVPAVGCMLFVAALVLSAQVVPRIRPHTARAITDLPSLVSTLFGLTGERTYLVLFQNHTELRPTGGFIGTYGIIKVRDARIRKIFVESAGHLDRRAPAELQIAPPEPLKRFLKIDRLQFRDANWHPDFRRAARELLWLYRLEGGTDAAKVDGVIAATPVFLEYLLRTVGPLTVEGVTFTADNVVDRLEYEVEVGFETRGRARPARKEIIGAFTAELYARIANLSPLEWAGALAATGRALEEKHLLIFDTDPSVQSVIEAFSWDGGMGAGDAAHDYLAIVDANLGGLKSDPHVHRSYEYMVEGRGSELMVTLSLHFDHRGLRDYKTSDYRTYTRVYVPAGATLKGSAGAFENATGQFGMVDTFGEAGKTTFGFFLEVPLQSRRTVTLTYALPAHLRDAVMQKGTYTVYVRTQPGAEGRFLTVTADFGKKMRRIEPTGEVQGMRVRWASDMRTDRAFSASFVR